MNIQEKLRFWETHWWCAYARLPNTNNVLVAKAVLSSVLHANANPHHSTISPKKLAPLTYSNIPPAEKKVAIIDSANKALYTQQMQTGIVLNIFQPRL